MHEILTEFIIPECATVDIGSLVWYYHSCALVGPLIVVDKRDGGYGRHKRKYWILFDTSKNEYHQAETRWLRVPWERYALK